MKAIIHPRYGSANVLEIKEIKTPEPKDNEVRVKIYAATVSATDAIFRSGKPFVSRSATGLLKPKHVIPGDIFSGEIDAVGKEVTRFKKGDRVYGATGAGFGAHAEYICLPENSALTGKPSNLNDGEAAAVCEGALTALPFLRDSARLQRGQKILINGASGSIGSIAVQLAKNEGAEVTGVCSTANMEFVHSLGADKVIDYTREDFTGNGEVYDVIFDSVGKSSFTRSKIALTQKGIYLSTVLTFDVLFQMLKTSKTGGKKAAIAFTGLRPATERVKDLTFLTSLIEAGQIKPSIDKIYSLTQIAEAHRYVETGHKRGVVVITVAE